MTDLIEYDDDLLEDGEPEFSERASWPYLAERGLSEAKGDLEKMLDRDMSEAEYEAVEAAINAIDLLFEKSRYKDQFRYFGKPD